MSTMIPSDVLMFIAELDQVTTALIEKYYKASEEDWADGSLEATKHFKHWAPISVRVFSNDEEIARFYEDGVDISPGK
mgnify:CR=1 FL=1